MLNMASFCLTFIMFMIAVSMVKGRWLELEPYSTLSMISDGIHDENYTYNNLRMGDSISSGSTTMLYGEDRCKSMYGFLPCADTMQEGVFLMVMYTYLMMLGEEWIGKGSHALFWIMGDKAIGASVFRVLMALPRIVLVIVAGVASTKSAAQEQVAFGMSMYAGSTLITLTFIWGFRIILTRNKLRGTEIKRKDEHQQDSSTKCVPLQQKLSFLNDNGVNIDESTSYIALIMLLSLIPFATVELVALIKSPVTPLFALIVSGISLVVYFVYQIGNPWVQVRSLAYLKEENLRVRFVHHIQKIAEANLFDQNGNPNLEELERIFNEADKDNDKHISHEELENWIDNVFKLTEDKISKDYAKAEIMTHFDDDKSGRINLLEFLNGCTQWLKKLEDDANHSNSLSKNMLNTMKNLAIQNKRDYFTRIEKIMPRILLQVNEKYELVNENGADKENIERLFSKYAKHSDNKIQSGELKEFIETLHFGVILDNESIVNELVKDFRINNNHTMEKDEFVQEFSKFIEAAIEHDPRVKDPKHAIATMEKEEFVQGLSKWIKTTIEHNSNIKDPKLAIATLSKDEFVQGFSKWIKIAIEHDPNIKDRKLAIAKFEEASWGEIDTASKMVKPEASIMYVIFGIGIMYVISGAFTQSVRQFSNAAHIPINLTSFVVFPIAMNVRMLIKSLLGSGAIATRNASLAFSEIYNGLVMNNLLGLLTLLITVYMKELSWTYSKEVLTIMIPCAVIGLFALNRDTYPVWASISAMLLYPIYACLYCVL